MTDCLERSDATIAIREGPYKVGKPPKDSISRLPALSASNALKFDLQLVVLNVGGLFVRSCRDHFTRCRKRAGQIITEKSPSGRAQRRIQAIDGFVFEALRFKPGFRYFFRTCERR